MSDRITIRNKIVALVKDMADFNDANVTLYKLDRVDSTPQASVYLGRMSSELSTMGGSSNSFERDVVIMVDFHSNHGTDADSQTDAWLVELEALIYRADGNGDFPDSLNGLNLEFAEFRPTATSNERRGDLVTVWRAEYDETLTLS